MAGEGARSSDDITQSAREFVRNLVTIEVNTIIKPGLTARKMPPVPLAVLEIIGKYYWFLLPRCDAHDIDQADLDSLAPDKRRNSAEAFETLRKVAARILSHPAAEDETAEGPDAERRRADYVVIDRIYRNASLLEHVLMRIEDNNQSLGVWNMTRRDMLDSLASFEKLRAVEIDQDDLVMVRKAWEMGAEKVVMQTAIQLDGDIVSRIAPLYAGPEHKALHDLHLASGRMGVETWTTIAGLVGEMIKGSLEIIGRALGVRT